MQWRDARDVRQSGSEESVFDDLERSIGPDRRVGDSIQAELICSPIAIEFKSTFERWDFPLAMLVTSTHVLAGRKVGMMKKRAQMKSWFRYDFLQFGTGDRGGRHFTVAADHCADGRIIFVFGHPGEAHELANYFADG
jgi:hypothetical protein